MAPDLESLRCFVSVATRLNFRQAAADVHLSPAALSSRIRQLEDALGAALLTRTTRSVAVTEAGIRLLPHAKQLIASAEACKRVIASTETLPFELTVGTRFELGMSWVCPALPKLDATVPHRTVHIRFGDSSDLYRHLDAGEIDAIITSSNIATSKFAFETLHREHYVFVASPKLWPPKKRQAPLPTATWTLLDISPQLPLLRYLTDTHGTSPWSFAGMRYLGSIAPIKEWVLRAAGVAVLPLYFVKTELAQRKLVPIVPSAKLSHDHFRLLWRQDHPRAADIAHLAQELRAIELS